jgi:hypothetical protein
MNPDAHDSSIIEADDMWMRFVPVFLLAFAAFGANQRLYLKDGDYQMVREYQVLSDRVHYFSTERGEWEDIPLDLVDLERTKKEVAAFEESLKKEAKEQDEEDAALRAERKEVASIPFDPGVYLIGEGKLVALKQGEVKVANDKRRSVLKVLSPIPIVPGKSTVEMDGDSAPFRVPSNTPEFYFRMASPEGLGIFKLTPKKATRLVENVTVMAVTNERLEDPQQVPTFKKQIADQLFKIWPEKPLEPGEYAVVEYTEGEVNVQVWDFGVDGAKPRGKK